MSQVTWHDIALSAARLGEDRGEWAGLPVPIHDHPLCVEKRHPRAENLEGAYFKDGELIRRSTREEDLECTCVNRWYSVRRRAWVLVGRMNGKVVWACDPESYPMDRMRMMLDTLCAVHVWREDAELQAMKKLRSHITERAYQCYLMAGQFLETSTRSGLTYLFRRLRPTIALRAVNDQMHLAAVLCLHPIGYYEGTFAGVMVPTDDVIAHLLMMRGDEARFWKKANHHSPFNACSGI